MTEPLDAIVVGAGAAGVGAASVLRASLARYVVLEATHRVGGRVRAFGFGATSRYVLENGANWVSGAGPPPTWPRTAINPLFHVALALNLSMVRVPGSATNMSNWAVSNERGAWADLDHAKRNLANRVTRCVSRIGSSESGSRLTAAAAAASCGWHAKDPSDHAIEWQLFTVRALHPPPALCCARLRCRLSPALRPRVASCTVGCRCHLHLRRCVRARRGWRRKR
jgi:monoamine oxidase